VNKTWSEVARFYEQLEVPSAKPMLVLVSAIEASHHSDGLFPWTSMMDLCIAQTATEYPNRGPYLRVSPISEVALELRHVDTWDERKQWHRTVPAEAALAELERFFDDLHWFVGPWRRSPSTLLFESTSNKFDDESELFRDLED
jgi:hypothetical protein